MQRLLQKNTQEKATTEATSSLKNTKTDALNTAKVKSEPSSKVKQTSMKRMGPVDAGKHSIKNSMPKVGPDGAAPVRYNGGVIYTAIKDCCFRVLTTMGDNYSEKRARWGDTKPSKPSWAMAVKAIDDARKLGK